ncbi:hypothetical protein ES708_05066 [subsurface metagenome]
MADRIFNLTGIGKNKFNTQVVGLLLVENGTGAIKSMFVDIGYHQPRRPALGVQGVIYSSQPHRPGRGQHGQVAARFNAHVMVVRTRRGMITGLESPDYAGHGFS